MQASVNTAVFLTALQDGMQQADCLKALIGKPIDNIEVRGEFFKPDTREAELSAIAALCQTEQWGFYFSIPEELFEAGQLNANVPAYLSLAQQYHMQGLKISLGAVPENTTVAVATLKQWLAAYSGTLTVENQPNSLSQLPAFSQTVQALLNAVPQLGYTFDAGNWYWLNERPEAAFDQLKDQITVFHLKDIAQQDTVMLGAGTTNWQPMVQQLTDRVPVFLEYAIALQKLDSELAKVNAVLAQR